MMAIFIKLEQNSSVGSSLKLEISACLSVVIVYVCFHSNSILELGSILKGS